MIEKGDIMMLDGNKEYTIVSITNLNDKTYVYLVDLDIDFDPQFMIGIYENNQLTEVNDPDTLIQLMEIFAKDTIPAEEAE